MKETTYAQTKKAVRRHATRALLLLADLGLRLRCLFLALGFEPPRLGPAIRLRLHALLDVFGLAPGLLTGHDLELLDGVGDVAGAVLWDIIVVGVMAGTAMSAGVATGFLPTALTSAAAGACAGGRPDGGQAGTWLLPLRGRRYPGHRGFRR